MIIKKFWAARFLVNRHQKGDALKIHTKYINHMNRNTTNISRTLVGNIIVDHSDEVGESYVGIAK